MGSDISDIFNYTLIRKGVDFYVQSSRRLFKEFLQK
ncbi:MAG: hypothetical protein K0R93_2595 [Anaerosolibacter sp.]|jgi:hypothetical protein|nr:hypothetical protein [Anaerosolibacter sp.]